MKRRPARRKCRSCGTLALAEDLVTEAQTHDARGYPIPVARWCPPCADSRFNVLAADPRCVEETERLRAAIARHAARSAR